MWNIVMYAKSEEAYNRAWSWLTTEFKDQPDVIDYLETNWLPLKEQWAEYYIRQHPNFGQCVTSQTESSNFSIKSYLVTGKSDFFKVAKSLKEMCRNQVRNYEQKVAAQATRVKLDFLQKPYLGDLPQAVSHLALDLITIEKRFAQKQINEAIANGTPDLIPPCEADCTIWLQYRLPCRHTIHRRLKAKKPLTLQDLDPRWLLDGRLDEERYLRIRDPPPAEKRRGRPKNDPVPVVRVVVPASTPMEATSAVAPLLTGPKKKKPAKKNKKDNAVAVAVAKRKPGRPKGNASAG